MFAQFLYNYLSLSIQANSGNLNNFIHLPTLEFLEGRTRKTYERDEGAPSNQDQAVPDTQELLALPPPLPVEVDPQLVQTGELRLRSLVASLSWRGNSEI